MDVRAALPRRARGPVLLEREHDLGREVRVARHRPVDGLPDLVALRQHELVVRGAPERGPCWGSGAPLAPGATCTGHVVSRARARAPGRWTAALRRTRGSSRASSTDRSPGSARRRTRLLSMRDASVSRSASHTSSADSSEQPLPKTASRAKSPCSRAVEKVVRPLDRGAERGLARIRVASGREIETRRNRSKSTSGVSSRVLAAASSIARGRRSSRSQSASTERSPTTPGRTARARRRNRSTASSALSGGRSKRVSAAIWSASRLETSRRSDGAASTSDASARAAAGRSCSTLSSTRSVRFSPTRRDRLRLRALRADRPRARGARALGRAAGRGGRTACRPRRPRPGGVRARGRSGSCRFRPVRGS